MPSAGFICSFGPAFLGKLWFFLKPLGRRKLAPVYGAEVKPEAALWKQGRARALELLTRLNSGIISSSRQNQIAVTNASDLQVFQTRRQRHPCRMVPLEGEVGGWRGGGTSTAVITGFTSVTANYVLIRLPFQTGAKGHSLLQPQTKVIGRRRQEAQTVSQSRT